MVEKKRKRGNAALAKFISSKEFATLIFLVVLVIVFSLMSPRFFMFWNVKNIMKQSAVNGILGIALFLIILTGGIDVSIGANLALQCVIIGHLVDFGAPLLVTIVVVMATGALTGGLMGLLVTKVDLPDLIVTLAAQNLIRGIALMFCQKSYNFFPDLLVKFGSETIGDILPWPFFWFAVIAVIIWIVLTKRRFGRNIYAVGGNRDAADMCGIHADRIKQQAYILSGVLVSVAALLYCGMYKSVLASKIGGDTVNTLLAIVLLGGVSMNGGKGSVGGVFIGAMIMAVINNGMILARSTDYWITAITGLLILLSLIFQYFQVNTRLVGKFAKEKGPR